MVLALNTGPFFGGGFKEFKIRSLIRFTDILIMSGLILSNGLIIFYRHDLSFVCA
jgi:hypothetical protein